MSLWASALMLASGTTVAVHAGAAPSPPPVAAAAKAPAAGPAAAASSAPIGWVDDPAGDTAIGPKAKISGWALDTAGIRGVEIRIGSDVHRARFGLARPDVSAQKPGFPDTAAPAFRFEADLGPQLDASPDGRIVAEIVAVSRSGATTVIGRRNVILPSERSPWRALHAARGASAAHAFHVVPGVSGVSLGGARELDGAYAGYLSPTIRAGMRVPILYMRTTLGKQGDWRFDPDWDVERKCGARRIAEDSLRGVIDYARKFRIPVLFTLNGGVWSDASCNVPQWDVVDHLETEVANCQWNERNEVMADDALKHLPGAQDSPELARMLTYNVYAERNRHYKRRNLQAAGRMVAAFARSDPELFIGINLDPDTAHNPFFEEKQWYDYNPATLRQFRHWLAGTGPYAGRGGPGVPDLRRYRRAAPLTLAEVNRISGRTFARWDDVDPPRSFPREGKPFWTDGWTHLWDIFRRHLIDLHYDELSRWLTEVGIPSQRIFSSQGFMAPHDAAMPFAVRIDSPAKNYDTGGISIEGAVPSHGHLGAVVYGPAARNDIRMETSDSLFATFHKLDPDWAIVEFNTADLRDPKALPTYAEAYTALRDAFNFGAQLLSPMAWNGSNGIFAGHPDYVSYMAWRNTPLEDAMRDFALSHAYVPRGSRLWTFGSRSLATDDGWSGQGGTRLAAGHGVIRVQPQGSRIELASPPGLALAAGEVDLLVLGLEEDSEVASVLLELRDGDGRFVAAGRTDAKALRRDAAGVHLPIAWPRALAATDQVRIVVELGAKAKPGGALQLRHIALYRAQSKATRTGRAAR